MDAKQAIATSLLVVAVTSAVGAISHARAGRVILGACNPPLAHRAVNIDRQIGLLLPCNVVVRTDPTADGRVLVEAIDPQMLVDVTGEAELRPVADEVATKLQAAIDSLEAPTGK
jgi:uncharacterized protein (DUF302 family)